MAFILKHGKTYKEIICKYCDALIAYSEKDIEKTIEVDNYFGEWHDCSKEFFKCPECGQMIFTKVTIDGEVQEDW